jgi:hypothetical protein
LAIGSASLTPGVVGAAGGRIIDFARINIEPTFQKEEIEDVREAGATSLNAAASMGTEKPLAGSRC